MAKKSLKSPGRPSKAAGDRRASILQVRLTDSERTLLDDVARHKGADTSTWLRVAILELARQIAKAEGLKQPSIKPAD